jgi:uncharacterized protein involved in exopolysaccharide biosynthesis
MPIGAQDSLDDLYARHRLLTDEAGRLEAELELLASSGPDDRDGARGYILAIEIAALREQASRVSARISDLLERDLQR